MVGFRFFDDLMADGQSGVFAVVRNSGTPGVKTPHSIVAFPHTMIRLALTNHRYAEVIS